MCARSAILALVVFCLAGCSGIKLAYNQADTVTAWLADDYFELTGEQRDVFRDHFQRLHGWHRSTQLHEYAALLGSVQRRLKAGVKEADVAWLIDSVKASYRTIVLRGHADAARVLSMLSEQQLNAARREFEKRNRKYAREWGISASPEEQQRLRAKQTLRRVEHWTGPLTAAQEARIGAMSRELPLVTEHRYRDRIRRQQEFLSLLESRKDSDAFAHRLRDWLADWDRSRASDYEEALERFVAASAKMYPQIYALLTPEQRAHINERLQRYITAFRELAQEPIRTTTER